MGQALKYMSLWGYTYSNHQGSLFVISLLQLLAFEGHIIMKKIRASNQLFRLAMHIVIKKLNMPSRMSKTETNKTKLMSEKMRFGDLHSGIKLEAMGKHDFKDVFSELFFFNISSHCNFISHWTETKIFNS